MINQPFGQITSASQISAGIITNTQIASNAAIALSKLQAANYSVLKPTNQAGTASTAAYVMCGLGAAATNPLVFTPSKTGNVFIDCSFMASNSLLGDGGKVIFVYGTGSAPANGAAATGTGITDANTALWGSSFAANAWEPFFLTGELTGLALNTQIWFDFQIEAITGGTFTVNNVFAAISELSN